MCLDHDLTLALLAKHRRQIASTMLAFQLDVEQDDNLCQDMKDAILETIVAFARLTVKLIEAESEIAKQAARLKLKEN